jgi:hypothetical protein
MLVRRNSGVFAAMRFGGGAEPSFMFEPVACGRRDATTRNPRIGARDHFDKPAHDRSRHCPDRVA